jgi:hypothetical protein
LASEHNKVGRHEAAALERYVATCGCERTEEQRSLRKGSAPRQPEALPGREAGADPGCGRLFARPEAGVSQDGER